MAGIGWWVGNEIKAGVQAALIAREKKADRSTG